MWMAGLSGVLRRMEPSAYQSPSISTAGKKMGMADDARTWRKSIVLRTPTRVTRFHAAMDASPSKNVTPRPDS